MIKTIASAPGAPSQNIEMTDEEIAAYETARQLDAAASAITTLKSTAATLLAKSDVTILRCAENGVEVPTEWAAYRLDLRLIVKNGEGTIPTRPDYPAGT